MKKLDTKKKVLKYVESLSPEDCERLYRQLKDTSPGTSITILPYKNKKNLRRNVKYQNHVRQNHETDALTMREFLALEF